MLVRILKDLLGTRFITAPSTLSIMLERIGSNENLENTLRAFINSALIAGLYAAFFIRSLAKGIIVVIEIQEFKS